MANELEETTPLSKRLSDECGQRGWTLEQASLELGQSKNAISRWVSLVVLPGPDKYAVIAEFLGTTIPDVGASLALDAVERRRRQITQ